MAYLAAVDEAILIIEFWTRIIERIPLPNIDSLEIETYPQYLENEAKF